MSPWFRPAALLLCVLFAAPLAHAGKIPGLPPPLPPGREAQLHFGWENDFLGRGGEFDDHRTQQLSLDARVGSEWHVVADHSILTHEGPHPNATDPPALEGRIDEWSLSIARRWQGREGRVLAGVGVRDIGQYSGARIQNGFHRLVGSRIVDLPYLTVRRTRPMVWLALDREDLRALGERGWQGGVWWSAAGQLAHGGRSDLRASALALVRRRAIEGRLGLRADWREGSRGNVVESATADNERGLFGALGIGVGPLELESYHRVDGGSAYGRATWRAGPSPTTPATPPGEYSLNLGVRLPETAWRVGGAWSPPGFMRAVPGNGRVALTLDYLSGETPADHRFVYFRLDRQLTAGLMWRGAALQRWVTPHVGIGAGWRREQLEATRVRRSRNPDDAAVMTGEMGLDARMAELPRDGQLALRLSLMGHLPVSGTAQGAGAGFSASVVYAVGR